MAFTIEIDASDIEEGARQLAASLPRELVEAADRAGDIVEAAARGEAPRRTGALAGSIVSSGGMQRPDGAEVHVDAGAAYALPVHDGSRPHTIRPFHARVLAFRVGGMQRFARSVNHPGNAPDPFMDQALEAKAREVEEAFGAGLERAIAAAGF